MMIYEFEPSRFCLGLLYLREWQGRKYHMVDGFRVRRAAKLDEAAAAHGITVVNYTKRARDIKPLISWHLGPVRSKVIQGDLTLRKALIWEARLHEM